MKNCANCGVAIGALEESGTWNGHPVCAGCLQRLRTAMAPAEVPGKPQEGQIECPFCHRIVTPVRKPKGDMATAVLLLLLFLIPGFIYMVTHSGFATACPACKTRIAEA